MTDKEIIIDGCEFQSDCIEYKDISYLKIMPICAIHELSIACHDKVNKCKYYKLYKQLKRKEQECEAINLTNERLVTEKYAMNEEIIKYKQALDEIKKFCKDVCDSCKKFTPNRQSDISCGLCQTTQILNIINKVKEE